MKRLLLGNWAKCTLLTACCMMAVTRGNLFAQQSDSLKAVHHTVMVSPYHSTEADISTAAISTIDGKEMLNLAGTNRTNLLNGRATGVLGIQANGELGIESNSLYIRGLRSLTSAGQQAALVVDGIYREDAASINPNDIESITILKDAAATALYGLRGGNGVILITTKRGSFNQPLKITFNGNFGVQSATRVPSYLGAYQYALLYNEASRNGGGSAVYDDYALESYRSGEDPYNYPNVDWLGLFMKKQSYVQRYNVDINGGSDRVRYFASVGYNTSAGLWNVDRTANSYGTNLNYDSYSLRSNIDVKVSKRLKMSMDIASVMSTWNYPGAYNNSTSRILNVLTQTPPNAYAMFNPDGSLGGNTQYTNNPYGLLNNSGYSILKTRSNYATLRFDENLDFITEGLSLYASVSFDSYFDEVINRNVGFVVYEGSLDNERGTKEPATQNNNNSFVNNYRSFDINAGVDYSRSFGLHSITGRLFVNENIENGNGKIMPHIYKGIMGFLHYDYDRRYVVDVTGAYQGSEQIGGNGYNLFPSIALGWVASNEEFLKDSPIVSFLKIRASYGVSGNDANIGYFQKSSFYSSIAGAYRYGESLQTLQGFRESQVGVDNVMAERSRKADIGLDTRLFGGRIGITADYFYEDNVSLLATIAAVPSIAGYRSTIKGNVGEIVNSGFEFAVDYTEHIGRLGYSLYGNFSFARNIIKEMQETDAIYRFNRKTGYPVNSFFGLKSDGLFYDEADIALHSVQNYGSYKPGDIKYVDLNNDGVVDENDRTYLGFNAIPEYVYGFGLKLSYGAFDADVMFQGVGNTQRKLGGYVWWEFRPDGKGNVMEQHLNRWAYDEAAGIDTRETATYPRLSLTGNDTNNRSPESDYWLEDGSYIRLKNVEIGFTLPKKAAKALHLSGLRLYVAGTNLLTFSKIGVVDPETSTTSFAYPIQRTISAGLSITY